ncbi:MAG: branched-chain amino acid ABC transporter permease [Deltaproteobacteria bacterium]|nr:MAG: branched-chain amino acid ABC transporter permease [Deltaproteobacteria bacterium]
MNGAAYVKKTILLILGMALLLAAPAILPLYWIMITTEVLIMGLFAMGFNLLLGYTGLLSFGQAGFFGVGAYTVALILSHGGTSVLLSLGAAVVVALITAIVIGYLCVRRDEIFFAMITLGFGMMLYTVAHNWVELTGGSDGLPLMMVPPLSFFGCEISLFDPVQMYRFVLVMVIIGIWILWRIVQSPFGLMLTAIRENRERLAFVGANVRQLRLAAFVIAGGVAGLAGGLFGLFNAMATPDIMHWSFSARPVLMTVLGGMGIFFGPMAGAAIYFGLEQMMTHLTQNWMIFLGLALIPVVIYFPKGILGSLVAWKKTVPQKRKKPLP